MIPTILSDVASIATLILFIIYFVGRIITIMKQRDIYYDQLEILLADDNKYDHHFVEEFHLDDDPYNNFVITSAQGIWGLKIYQYQLDDNYQVLGKSMVATYPFLNINHRVAIYLTVPELIPRYCVEYTTADFKRVTFDLKDNMKSSVLSEIARPKHTWRSVLYYLFR